MHFPRFGSFMESSDSEPEVPDVAAVKNNPIKGMEPLNLKLEVFDPESMIDYFTTLIYGCRRIGKTFLASWILSKIGKRFDEAHLYSKTSQIQPDAWDMIPKENHHVGFDETDLKKRIGDQKKQVNDALEQYRKAKKDGRNEKFDKQKQIPHLLIVLDDIVSDPNVYSSELLKDLFILGRHYHISVIVLSQNTGRRGSFCTDMRDNADYVFASCMKSHRSLETLAEDYFGVEGTKRGMQMLHEITQKENQFAVAELHLRARTALPDYVRTVIAEKWRPFHLKSKKRKTEIPIESSYHYESKRRQFSENPHKTTTYSGDSKPYY